MKGDYQREHWYSEVVQGGREGDCRAVRSSLGSDGPTTLSSISLSKLPHLSGLEFPHQENQGVGSNQIPGPVCLNSP